MSPFSPLETSRLLLREVLDTDAHSIFFLRSDPTVNALVKRSQPKNLQEALTFIQQTNAKQKAGEIAYWGIQKKGEGGLIGTICLWNFSTDRRRAEVGYDLHPAVHRQGIMSEALDCVMDYGWNHLALNSIESYTQFNNEASVRLLLGHGFVLEEGLKDADNPYNRVYISHSPKQA